MAFIYVEPNTTFCENTPANRGHFERLKSGIGRNSASKKGLMAMELNKRLQAQESKENASLRELSRCLPGHEPDR